MSSDLVALNHTLGSIGPALANHLWQSTAFAAGAWLLALALRSNQARVRHAVWLAASIKFLVPFSLLIAAGNLLPHPKQPVAPAVYSAMDVVEEPFAEIALPPAAPVIHTPTMRERLEAVLPATLAAIWLVGAGVVLVVWASRWRVVRRTLREAEPAYEGRELEILRRLEERFAGGRRARPLPLRLSAERMEPGIVGVRRPELVWPRELSARLDDEHIEAIVAHELAHVRRRDNLTAAVHMLVETAFWFHPAVWWMERQMVKEREQACDEAVVEMGGDAQNFAEIYAESLLKTCRFCIESPLACVAGVTGADLKQRVVGIVTGRALLRMSWPKKLLLAGAAVCVVTVPVVLGQANAAQRLILAAIKDAPKPIQFAAHAMLTEGQEPAGGEIAASTQDSANREQPSPDPAAVSASSPQFDAVTIKPTNPNSNSAHMGFSGSPGGRIYFGGNARTFIEVAYGLQDYQVSGGPDWIEEKGLGPDWFVINAVPPDDSPSRNITVANGEPTADQRRMLQSLLRDRFGLQCHFETKEGEVYFLTRGAKPLQFVAPKDPDAPPGATVIFKGTDKGMIEDGEARGRNTTIDYLAIQFSRYLRLPVINQTGVTGSWDFHLDPVDPDNQDIPTAVYSVVDRLGLKIKRGRGPVQTLIIDHIEKPTVDGAEVTPAASVVPVAMVQGATGQQTNESAPRMMAKDADPDWEVVTVKPSDPNANNDSFDVRGRHVIVKHQTVELMLLMAYGVQKSQIVGAPDWVKTERWDLEGVADVDGQPNLRQFQTLVRKVLTERFGMKLHHEQREMPVFALTVAKGGPKMDASKDDPNGHPNNEGTSGNGRQIRKFTNTSMSDLALMLLIYVDRPVVDQTGLRGRYDFSLKWTSDDARATEPDAPPGLFTAIQEQAGLKLESVKAPADVVVIDSVARPSAN